LRENAIEREKRVDRGHKKFFFPVEKNKKINESTTKEKKKTKKKNF